LQSDILNDICAVSKLINRSNVDLDPSHFSISNALPDCLAKAIRMYDQVRPVEVIGRVGRQWLSLFNALCSQQ
jgi:hypothetical protein